MPGSVSSGFVRLRRAWAPGVCDYGGLLTGLGREGSRRGGLANCWCGLVDAGLVRDVSGQVGRRGGQRRGGGEYEDGDGEGVGGVGQAGPGGVGEVEGAEPVPSPRVGGGRRVRGSPTAPCWRGAGRSVARCARWWPGR